MKGFINCTNANPWKHLVFSFLHWVIVVILSIISYVLQYSFMIDTGERYSSFIFSGSVYRVNAPMFTLGVTIFFIGYYFLWKKYLFPDWKAFAKCFWIWKAAYVLIVILALCAVSFAGIVILFFYVGLSINLTPEWTMWGCVAFPVYMLLVVLAEIVGSKRKCSI